jgi:hypothetical protein
MGKAVWHGLLLWSLFMAANLAQAKNGRTQERHSHRLLLACGYDRLSLQTQCEDL